MASREAPPIHVSENPWELVLSRLFEPPDKPAWDAQHRGTYLGSGLLGVRIGPTGLSPEPAAGVPGAPPESFPAYLAGHYVNESLTPLPALLKLQISSEGKPAPANGSGISRYSQSLSLSGGLVKTEWEWNPGSGAVRVEYTAAVLRQRPNTALVFAKLQNGSTKPLDIAIPEGAVSGGKVAGDTVAWEGEKVRCAIRLRPVDASEAAPGSAGGVTYSLPAGQSGTFLLTAEVTGPGVPAPGAPLPDPMGQAEVEKLLAANRDEWRKLWVPQILIDGDLEAQQVVNACMFYLLGSTRAGVSAGVPPMGLSSGAFSGHVFWDMDSWMFPALLPLHPDLAKEMLEYRFRTLDGAKANARAEGLPGATYAWESAATGKEALQGAVYRHGRHVTGDVALALKQYYAATGDKEWLAARAWPILQPTADYWVARAKPDGKGGFVVKQVTTPDENAGLVDHSAWTHHVARVNLEFAAQAAKDLGRPVNPKWSQVAKGLSYLRNPANGLILPYAGFKETTRAKQADVMLLVHPGEAEIAQAELGKMYDYYVQRVIPNGPAMTDAIHAIAAARLGRDEEARKRFRLSYLQFVRPPFHLFSEKRTRDNLCFLTGAAGVVEAVLYGFVGLRPEPDPKQPDRPLLEPHVPKVWNSIRVKNLHWRGKRWDVTLRPGEPAEWSPATNRGPEFSFPGMPRGGGMPGIPRGGGLPGSPGAGGESGS